MEWLLINELVFVLKLIFSFFEKDYMIDLRCTNSNLMLD